jgi:hypothetical protein
MIVEAVRALFVLNRGFALQQWKSTETLNEFSRLVLVSVVLVCLGRTCIHLQEDICNLIRFSKKFYKFCTFSVT